MISRISAFEPLTEADANQSHSGDALGMNDQEEDLRS